MMVKCNYIHHGCVPQHYLCRSSNYMKLADVYFCCSGLMLRALCQHILSPQFTEPVKLFIIPALTELPYFPFRQLLEVLRLHAHTVPATTWLLFTVLSLERKHFGMKLLLSRLWHILTMYISVILLKI